ncbi:hypothetical protein [Nocardia wallacei]|uniref:hypothetical protein n=1 Tax=Nocardia wallacei TaxID=480035 RepID=UPI00245539A0|nr:hypothetical protein [Nocardia wallacei]
MTRRTYAVLTAELDTSMTEGWARDSMLDSLRFSASAYRVSGEISAVVVANIDTSDWWWSVRRSGNPIQSGDEATAANAFALADKIIAATGS